MSAHIKETRISKAIADGYHQKLIAALDSDVIIIGAGPAGLTAASILADKGKRVTIVEKRLTPGGGVWGGGMGMNEIVIQEEALPLIETAGIRHKKCDEGLYTVDAVEMASSLCVRALHSGAVILNLMTLEDVCVRGGKVDGVVVCRSMISGVLPVDPIMLDAKAVIDGTGHEAVAVNRLRKRHLLPAEAQGVFPCEGPMDAAAGEDFVVDHAGEAFPGLWVLGMAVCATYGGPRMGPIFGGMLMSGKRVAEQILAKI
jgi:thiazole biosynthesis enzyme